MAASKDSDSLDSKFYKAADGFFPAYNNIGLTYDDVTLATLYSEVLPRETQLGTTLAEGLQLNIPIISSDMDTVTESRMAIAMAAGGGIGFVHKNLSIEEQAAEVVKVKKYESAVVGDPITIEPDAPIHRALGLMRENGISGIPIVQKGKLVGILTNRDLRFEKNLEQKVADVMTKDLVTARVGVTIEEAKDLLHRHRIEKLLVVNDAFELKGLITIKDIEKIQKHPNAAKDSLGRLLCGAAVGVGADREARIQALLKAGADVIAIDTAHGHSKGVIDAVRATKANFKGADVVAGNVATYDAAEALCKAGVDAVKCGVGPGSICTTRVVSGAGMPQITAIAEAARAAAKTETPIIADGGIKFSGDIAKAIAAGAHSVMLGGLFAGTEEAPGEVELFQGRSYKSYRGMGSLGAMQQGSSDRYFQDGSEANQDKLVPEGVEAMVPYRGAVKDTLYQLVGGLRSGLSYAGATSIEDLWQVAEFIRITSGGQRESSSHDVNLI